MPMNPAAAKSDAMRKSARNPTTVQKGFPAYSVTATYAVNDIRKIPGRKSAKAEERRDYPHPHRFTGVSHAAIEIAFHPDDARRRTVGHWNTEIVVVLLLHL